MHQMVEKFATCADIHDKEELLRALESPVQLYEKWMIDLLQDLTLCKDRF